MKADLLGALRSVLTVMAAVALARGQGYRENEAAVFGVRHSERGRRMGVGEPGAGRPRVHSSST